MKKITDESAEIATIVMEARSNPVYFRAIMTKKFGSRVAADLLNQILYWTTKMKRPFYKFKMPCGHKAYQINDSWAEELGVGEAQLGAALKKIATPVSSHKEAVEATKSASTGILVAYYKEGSNLSWYHLNKAYFIQVVYEAVQQRKSEEAELAKKFNKNINITSVIEENEDSYEEIDRTEKIEVPITKNNYKNIYNAEKEEKNIFDQAKEVKSKDPLARKQAKNKQPPIDRAFLGGKKMPLDFSLQPSIIAEALEQGYVRDEIATAFNKFKFYYTQGKGLYTKHLDWNRLFLDKWLQTSYEFGQVTRNGKSNFRDANQERLDALKRKAIPISERVQFDTIEELVERVKKIRRSESDDYAY